MTFDEWKVKGKREHVKKNLECPCVLSGSLCLSGKGKAVVVAVGKVTSYGSIVRKKFPTSSDFGSIAHQLLFKHEAFARFNKLVNASHSNKAIRMVVGDNTFVSHQSRVCEAYISQLYFPQLLDSKKFSTQFRSSNIPASASLSFLPHDVSLRILEAFILITTLKQEHVQNARIQQEGSLSQIDAALLHFVSTQSPFKEEMDLSIRKRKKRIADFPYSNGRKTFVVDSDLPLNGKTRVSYTFGYFEDMIDICDRSYSDANIVPIEREKFVEIDAQFGENLLKPIVLAVKELSEEDQLSEEKCQSNSVLVGLFGVKKPVVVGLMDEKEREKHKIKVMYITKLPLRKALQHALDAGIISSFEDKKQYTTADTFLSWEEHKQIARIKLNLKVIAEANGESKKKIGKFLSDSETVLLVLANNLRDLELVRIADFAIAMRRADEPTKDAVHAVVINNDLSTVNLVLTGSNELNEFSSHQFK